MGERLSGPQLALWAGLGVVLLLLGVRVAGATDGPAPDSAAASPLRVKSATAGAGAEGTKLVVHVAGEVQSPGVYGMPAGSRVADAVEEAGGATSDGALDSINLAAPLADGQQVVVPASVPAGTAVAAGAVTGPISLGSATQADLEQLDGIGPVTAASIIEFRDSQGGVSSVEDLDQISGIGPATIEAIGDDLQP